MGVFDQILAAAQQVYPFTWLSLSLTIFFSVIVLGIAIAAIRGFFARRRAREEAEDLYEYRLPAVSPEESPRVVLDELLAEQASVPVHAPAAETELEAVPAEVAEAADLAAPSPEPDVEPEATEARASAATPAVDEGPDDLTMLRGIGPRLAERLNTLGITRFVQLAMLDPGEAAALDAKLGANRGQLERDSWIDQAQMLAIGDIAGFEARYANA
jgi:predicted flap endonuclease-1-like 5' DNA nuclease